MLNITNQEERMYQNHSEGQALGLAVKMPACRTNELGTVWSSGLLLPRNAETGGRGNCSSHWVPANQTGDLHLVPSS